MRKHLMQLIRRERPAIDVWHFFVGNYRHHLYYSKFKFLIRKYIREQITFRINNMNRECYNNGECIHCGCATTALQMANKVCEGNCYPPFLPKKGWNLMPKFIKDLKRIDYVEE